MLLNSQDLNSQRTNGALNSATFQLTSELATSTRESKRVIPHTVIAAVTSGVFHPTISAHITYKPADFKAVYTHI
ncbi:hypothetical protein ACROYT_G008625 [Oculina patagonica]